jgi:hypothetical protein
MLRITESTDPRRARGRGARGGGAAGGRIRTHSPRCTTRGVERARRLAAGVMRQGMNPAHHNG